MALRDVLDRAEDAAIARFRRDAARVVERISGELARLLRVRGLDELSRGERIKVLVQLEAQWSSVLREAGWDKAVGRLQKGLGSLAAKIAAAAADETGASRVLLGPTERRVQSLLDGMLDDVEKLQRVGAKKALREAVMAGGAAPVARDDLIAAVAQKAALSAGRAVSLVDTTVMGADRTVAKDAAEEAGFRLFLYDGPEDMLTRPWCAARVGRVFTPGGMDATPNDTGPQPPSVYGGGWNCRHRWVPLTRAEAAAYPRWR